MIFCFQPYENKKYICPDLKLKGPNFRAEPDSANNRPALKKGRYRGKTIVVAQF